MRNMLIPESPLTVSPTIAGVIGIDEAHVLQQIHYWLTLRKNERDGRYWVYNTVEEWAKQFPWMSERTVRRVLASLRDRGLLIATDQYNKMAVDRTLWYTIDYDKVDEMFPFVPPVAPHTHSEVSNLAVSSGQSGPSNNQRLTTDTTTTGVGWSNDFTRVVKPVDYNKTPLTKTTTTPSVSPAASGTPLQLGLDVKPGKTVQVPLGTTILKPTPWNMVEAFNAGLEKNGRVADYTTPGMKRFLKDGKRALDMGMTEQDVLETTTRLTKSGFWKDKPLPMGRVIDEWAAQPKREVTIRSETKVESVFNPFEGG